jgi:hypothetical protein
MYEPHKIGQTILDYFGAGESKHAERFGLRRRSAALGSPIPVGFKFAAHIHGVEPKPIRFTK